VLQFLKFDNEATTMSCIKKLAGYNDEILDVANFRDKDNDYVVVATNSETVGQIVTPLHPLRNILPFFVYRSKSIILRLSTAPSWTDTKIRCWRYLWR
jgi:hypothetical protein